MKKSKIFIGIAILAVAGFFVIAADHIDAPATTANQSSDITDLYAFQGQNTSNIAFVVNVQGLMSPADTGSATFDENVMVEINIDTNGDAVEDMVIQAAPRDGKMYFFGPSPVTGSQTGTSSTFLTGVTPNSVDITPYGSSSIVGTNAGMSFFAGPRDDPFFFDFGQFSAIIAGTATMFNNPGTDTFAGTNVMSIVVEVPKAMLGGGSSINAWVETKRKQ
ncbi:MAG: DUF4331 family protein [Aquaticitalea sp.]